MRSVSFGTMLLALFLAACTPPNVEALDADLSELDTRLQEIDAELAEYPGGLINGLLVTRKHLTGATKDMLEQKRASLLYWIDLKYPVDGTVSRPATREELDAILAELRQVDAQIALAEAEAAYTGGLVGALKQAEVATLKLSAATIRHRYYAEKYGVPVILSMGDDDERDTDARIKIDPSEL